MSSLKLPVIGDPAQPRPARAQWRSLAERERGVVDEGEFPPGADQIGGTSRREFVQLLGATVAFAGASGCLKQPAEQMLPYTHQPDEIVLTINADTEVHIARDDIESLQPGTVSIMPSGLDQQLSPQELSDLIAFLKACK